MKPNVKKIRDAICANRGGWLKASDQEIMMLWDSLDKQTQDAYLKSTEKKPRETKDAPNM